MIYIDEHYKKTNWLVFSELHHKHFCWPDLRVIK